MAAFFSPVLYLSGIATLEGSQCSEQPELGFCRESLCVAESEIPHETLTSISWFVSQDSSVGLVASWPHIPDHFGMTQYSDFLPISEDLFLGVVEADQNHRLALSDLLASLNDLF